MYLLWYIQTFRHPLSHCTELLLSTLFQRQRSRLQKITIQKRKSLIHITEVQLKLVQSISDLIRDIGLTKSITELSSSRLKQWNLLDERLKISENTKLSFDSGSNWPDFSRQMESPVDYSSIAHPGCSKPYCFITGAYMHLFPWLTRCSPARKTLASRSCK